MSGDTGSFVAVDPANVATLAARIHDLVTAIATESPKIKTLMQNWGDYNSWSQLPTVLNRFADQAIAMKKRADLAGELAKGTVTGFGVDPSGYFRRFSPGLLQRVSGRDGRPAVGPR